MEDLLDNFTNQTLESPTEEDYKYHFTNDSPGGSERERSIHPRTSASAGPSNGDPFFNIEFAGSPQATGGDNENEENYNADVEDDDDEHERDVASRYDTYRESSTAGASYNQKSLFESDTDNFEHPSHGQDNDAFETEGFKGRATSENVDLTPAPSTDRYDGMDGFAQNLRRFRRQDMERDKLLTQLHQENMDLKRTLRESAPNGNARAEAAERSLFEIRKTFAKNPYVCVLIDGMGYKVHEDLLQMGKRGGAEAADRLRMEVSSFLQQFGDVKSWEIMVHLYIDIGGLLARCASNDIPLSNDNIRDFMLGFTQAQPLFTTVDVGYDPEKLSRKVEGMFHLFVNNVQCKHLIFGCCHNSAYAVILEPYTFNPFTASGITLLRSYEDKTCFEDLPFESVEFPHVFRSMPFKKTDRLAEDVDYMQNLPQKPGSGRITRGVEVSGTNELAGQDEAIAKWQDATNASIPLPARARARPQAKVHLDWAPERNVLLNVNDERVDHELGDVDDETLEKKCLVALAPDVGGLTAFTDIYAQINQAVRKVRIALFTGFMR